MQTDIEIQSIDILQPSPDSIAAFSLGSPKPGDSNASCAINFSGWISGVECPVKEISIYCGKRLFATTPVSIERPDVVQAHPNLPNTLFSGFSTSCSTLNILQNGLNIIELRAEFSGDKPFVPIARIAVNAPPLLSGSEPSINPLLVSGQGRSGSTYLMSLVSQHPEIIAHDTYPYETKIGQYWAHLLQVLSQPASSQNQKELQMFFEKTDSIGPAPFFAPQNLDTSNWLGSYLTHNLGDFCRLSAEEFYLHLATQTKKAGCRFFCEKYSITRNHGYILSRLWPETKELILVRDPRDRLASMTAFNDKRNYKGFGFHKANSILEFVRNEQQAMLLPVERWKENQDHACLVRYEDLVCNPNSTLTRIFSYMGVDSDAPLVQKILSAKNHRSKKMQYHQTSTSPRDSIGRWKKDLDTETIDLTNELLNDYLVEFEYA